MNDKKLTKKVLAEVASDLSKAMDFENPINTSLDKITGKPVTKDQIITDLKEAGKELLAKDVISDLSREVLTFLKVKLPEPAAETPPKSDGKTPEEEKTSETTKTAKAGENGKKEKPSKKEAKKTEKYTRAQAFCDALQGKPKTIEEIGQKMLELYQKHGSATKHTQLKSVVWAAMIYIHPITLLGFVKKEDQKYSLIK